jgi:hypothetical protein
MKRENLTFLILGVIAIILTFTPQLHAQNKVDNQDCYSSEIETAFNEVYSQSPLSTAESIERRKKLISTIVRAKPGECPALDQRISTFLSYLRNLSENQVNFNLGN